MIVAEPKTKKLPKLLYGFDAQVATWVADRIPDVLECGFDKATAIGVISADESKLIAGVVYHDYQPKFETMGLSIASDSPMWARKELIKELLAYPFIDLNIFKCWIVIPEDNEKSLKITAHIGFKREALVPHHFGKQRHAVTKRMYKPDYMRLYEGSI